MIKNSQQYTLRDKKILFIINPTACHGTATEIIPEIEAYFGRQNIPYELLKTNAPRHATQLAKENANKYDVIIGIGGDGTAHETANGIMQACYSSEGELLPGVTPPVFGVIPFGSGNDYGRTIGMYGDRGNRVEMLLSSNIAPYDVGICNGEYYIETFSVGLDANIANRTIYLREQGSKLKDTPLYLAAAKDVFLKFYDPLHLIIDRDGEIYEGNEIICAIQLGYSYGGGFPIALNADVNDGKFDTITADFLPRRVALPLFLKVMKGKHGDRTDVFNFGTHHHVHIKADHVVTGQLDGEPWTFDEFDLSIIPNALQVLVNPKVCV